MKIIASIILLAAVLASGSSAHSADQRERVVMEDAGKLASYCIEGHVFVVALGPAYGDNRSYVPAIVQVYEEGKNGKVVPKRCKSEK